MLTGKNTRNGENKVEILVMISRKRMPSVTKLIFTLPGAVERLNRYVFYSQPRA